MTRGTAEQLIADIIEEYQEEYQEGACASCEACGNLVMCMGHSILSALAGNTWTNAAIARNQPPFKSNALK